MNEKTNKKGFGAWFRDNWKNNALFSTGIALIVMVILQTLALGFNYASFGEWFGAWINNWMNILRNNSSVGIIALGMTFVIISGGIDLAVGSTLVAVGAITMTLIDAANGGWLGAIGLTGAPAYIVAILISVAAGIIFGGLNGLMVTAGKIPPFIATLGAMKILRSVTQQFMQSSSPKVPTGFQQIARVKVGGQMFMPILYWLLIALVLYIVSKKTVFGRHVFAVGSNEKTSRLSGINVNRVKLGVYALMGAVVAIAAVLQVSRIGAMDPANAGSGYELDSIAAVIVGGTSMSGGKGSVVGTVFGMLIIAVMNNLLNLLGVPPFLREAFKGAIIIAAAALTARGKNRRGKRLRIVALKFFQQRHEPAVVVHVGHTVAEHDEKGALLQREAGRLRPGIRALQARRQTGAGDAPHPSAALDVGRRRAVLIDLRRAVAQRKRQKVDGRKALGHLGTQRQGAVERFERAGGLHARPQKAL